MQSIKPGCNTYINTDYSGRYFPDHYAVSMEDEAFLTPTGIPVGEKLEYGELFTTDAALPGRFAELGYPADTLEILDTLLEDTGMEVHCFEDPYSLNELTDEEE